MSIEPISTLKLNAIDITPLLPKQSKPKTIIDILPKPKNDLISMLYDAMNYIVETKIALIQLNNQAVTGDVDSGADYERYLQYPNGTIKALAASIVKPSDDADTKMYKIEQWVKNNITYVSDIKQYRTSELWAYPTMTVNSKEGDCEDGAFLMHSLALHVGIDPDRLRTYGGIVITSDGTGVGGHAWTAYKRESDDEWIVLDWCYWPKSTALSERGSMSEDLKYIDDYFFVQATKTVETPYANRVRMASAKPLIISIRA
jgi:predicted transglutaminase-like cysteine proteinase